MILMRILSVVLVVVMTIPAIALQPDEILEDAELELRARDLSTELRCLVCQNQSIDDSDAPLARDLRLLIRERLVVGDSDDEVIDFVVARYGEFVLLRPPFAPHTWALWLAAPVLLILGALAVFASFRRRSARGDQKTVPLSSDEQSELQRILKR